MEIKVTVLESCVIFSYFVIYVAYDILFYKLYTLVLCEQKDSLSTFL